MASLIFEAVINVGTENRFAVEGLARAHMLGDAGFKRNYVKAREYLDRLRQISEKDAARLAQELDALEQSDIPQQADVVYRQYVICCWLSWVAERSL